jgi:hypothetical protein
MGRKELTYSPALKGGVTHLTRMENIRKPTPIAIKKTPNKTNIYSIFDPCLYF